MGDICIDSHLTSVHSIPGRKPKGKLEYSLDNERNQRKGKSFAFIIVNAKRQQNIFASIINGVYLECSTIHLILGKYSIVCCEIKESNQCTSCLTRKHGHLMSINIFTCTKIDHFKIDFLDSE